MKRPFCLLSLFLSVLTATWAWADVLYDQIHKEYPNKSYIVGIGEKESTGNSFSDKRVAEVLARLEIARQIKVRVREETIDIMCEGGTFALFNGKEECRDKFIMVIEVTVDEFLQGSKIVDHGKKDGVVYAVAVLPRGKAGEELYKNTRDAIRKTRESIKKARQGDKASIEKAQEEYLKAVTYNKEKEIIEGVKGEASKVFEELESEIADLKKKRIFGH